MAFQQPARQPAQRIARAVSEQDVHVAVLQRPSSSEREPEGSRTWVLFSPPTDVTTTSYLSESDHLLETPGRSLLSDLGSLNTAARSEEVSVARQSSILSATNDQQVADEDAELDSLDSHLPDFRSVPRLSPTLRTQPATPVFPSHDGLGSFRLDRPVIGIDAQDHIYRFEEFNPRKARLRQDSFDHTQLNLGEVFPQEDEKRRRIEAWRLEHSRVLIDEVQRETRRRQKSLGSLQRSKRSVEADADNLTWHDEDAIEAAEDQQSFIARIARRVVKDLLDIDDAMLSILLGQELPVFDAESLSSTPRASQFGAQSNPVPDNETSWQLRIIARLSQELGLLVNHLSPHPGAFTTYAKMQLLSLPYAGLPVIPESSHVGAKGPVTKPDASQISLPEFQPTTNHHQSPPIDIPSRKQDALDDQKKDTDMIGGDFSKEEWEKSLDVKLVFRYLLSRFASRPSTSPPSSSAGYHDTQTQQDHAAKVARVRQNHPLVARTRPVERRCFKAIMPSSPVALRYTSSCASQSTKLSAKKRRSSCSSHHYWDIGGSLGTGSVIASNGPMGSWGEV